MDSPNKHDVNITLTDQSVVSALTEAVSAPPTSDNDSTLCTGTSTSVSTTANVQKKRRNRSKGGSIGRRHKTGKKSPSNYTPITSRAERHEESNANVESTECEAVVDSSENSNTQRRLLIALMYQQLGAPPPREWNGNTGTVATIIKSCHFPSNTRNVVWRVLLRTRLCLQWGIPYTGTKMNNGGRPQHTIKDGSYEQKLVANFIERGASIKCTQAAINIVKLRLNLPPVTWSAIYECIGRMNSRVVSAEKRAQGNVDANSKWAIARYAQTDQMVRMIGINPKDEWGIDDSTFRDNDGNLLSGHSEDSLAPYKVHKYGILWVDESHRKCRQAELGHDGMTCRQFTRNDKGDYDPNGLYANAPKICNHKYVNEVCMAYGVATVEDKDGKVEGVCMYPFDYLGKWLCSEEEIEGHRLLAIRAHRASMGRQSKAWYESNRIDGAYYLEEGVENVKGIGKKANLLKAYGIKTVNNL